MPYPFYVLIQFIINHKQKLKNTYKIYMKNEKCDLKVFIKTFNKNSVKLLKMQTLQN